ncbi:hypothetical protein D3C79_986940 [compost metagenome]
MEKFIPLKIKTLFSKPSPTFTLVGTKGYRRGAGRAMKKGACRAMTRAAERGAQRAIQRVGRKARPVPMRNCSRCATWLGNILAKPYSSGPKCSISKN